MKKQNDTHDINGLENILQKTIKTLNESRKDIFSISEASRNELENIKNELELVNEDINKVIDKLDKMEEKNQRARIRLMQVSKDIHNHSESDIKQAYKKAEDTSVKIAVLKEKEEQLKERRCELEERVVNLKKTVKKADNLVSKVGIVMDYLQGELSDLSEQFDDLRQKQRVAIKVIQAQEEERKRVAREIHDGPAQSLANLVFRVELTKQLIDKDLDKAKNELSELKGIVRLSVKDVRKIIYDLRPMSLDDLGLIPTLHKYIDKFNRQGETVIDLRVLGEQRRLPSSHEVTIFRLIQEALNNIDKHAKATFGRVSLEYTKNQINLLIHDNGKGFKENEVNGDKYGLISMKERCELLGGEIDIKTSIDHGTRIKITIPV